MSTTRFPFHRFLEMRLLRLTLLLSAVAVPLEVGAAELALPEDTVVAAIQYTPEEDATFAVTLQGVGEGYDVHDGTYDGWCVENNGNPTHYQVLLYSSYDPDLPAGVAFYQSDTIPAVSQGQVAVGDPVPWDELNYLLNHKQGNREDIQAAVWQLIWGDASTLALTPTASAMLDAAAAEGDGFEPGPGDIQAVILYVDGLQQEGYQETVIEVPVPAPAAAALGDRVWEDVDRDGLQDTGVPPDGPEEPGVPGVAVSLLRAGADGLCSSGDETWVATTVTDDDGRYRFDDLEAGAYCVTFLPSSGWRFTILDAGDEARDSDADPATGGTDVVLLGPGEVRLDVDAGLYREPCETTPASSLVLAYRDSRGALSRVESDTGRTEPLRVGDQILTTGLQGTTTAAFNPSDGLVYLATGEGDDALYALDAETGALTRVGPLTGGASNLQAMDFAPGPAAAWGFIPGGLYGVSIDGMEGCGPNCLFRIDPESGEATPIAPLNANQIRGASFDPVTGELWVYDPGDKTLSTLTADGTMTRRLRVPDSHQDARTGVDTVFSLAHDCAGNLFAIDIAYGVLVRIDLEAQQAYWVADYGSAASAFGSFEGNGLDALDTDPCVCDPASPPVDPDRTDGGTTTPLTPADAQTRTAPACSAAPLSSGGVPLWTLCLGASLPWLLTRRHGDSS